MDDMIRSIRDSIISGKRKVGDFLPSERELGKMYGISNKTVRQCLDVLVAEGLIEKLPKVGNRVAGVSDDNSIAIRFGCHRSTVEELDLGTLLAMFHKQYPHIRVQTVTFEHFESVRNLLEAGLMDVATVNVANFRDIVENDAADLLTEQRPNPDIYPFLTKSFLHDGRLLVQPITFSPVVLCYNRKHFRERGILEPDSGWTWEDLKRAADRLAIPSERYGFYFYLLAGNRWPVFLLQSGMKLPPPDEPVRLYDTPWMEGLRLCRDTVMSHGVMPSLFFEEADAEQLFKQEKVSMIMTTYFGLNRLKDAEIEYDIAPLPAFRNPHTLLIAIGLGLNARSDRKEAAQTFIDFITSYPSQLAVRQRTMSIPAVKPAAEWIGPETMYRPYRYPMHRDIVPTYRLYTDLNVTTEMLAAIFNEVKLYWAGLESEQAVCANIERALNAIRQRHREAIQGEKTTGP
jgi:multiple sugar transport system substrate-binding protein